MTSSIGRVAFETQRLMRCRRWGQFGTTVALSYFERMEAVLEGNREMVVLTRELLLRTIGDWEQRADDARLTRDYSELARFWFGRFGSASCLGGAPRADGERSAPRHVMNELYRGNS